MKGRNLFTLYGLSEFAQREFRLPRRTGGAEPGSQRD
jgi:hypothetical protein